MTNAQLIEIFAAKLIHRVTLRMEAFGDDYEKAKRVVMLGSVAGPEAWALVDAKFANAQ